MRLLLFILGVFAAIICIEKPAEAQDYPWCAYYNFERGGARNCGFATWCASRSPTWFGTLVPAHQANLI